MEESIPAIFRALDRTTAFSSLSALLSFRIVSTVWLSPMMLSKGS